MRIFFQVVFVLLIISAILFESSIFPFPLVLLLSFAFVLLYKNATAFITVFISGIILDSLLLHTLGVTALFLFVVLLIILLLEKVFSLQGSLFVAVILFLSTVLYGVIYSYPFSILLYIILGGLLLLYVLIKQRIIERESNR